MVRKRLFSTADKDCSNDIKWTCVRCKLLLGKVDQETKRTLRIKIRDAYYWVVDAKVVSAACKRCGAFNEIKQSDDVTPAQSPERIETKEE